MNYRNAQRLSSGWIDCEIEHETFGWIPFTCNPNDTGAQFDVAALHAQMEADPFTADYVEPPAYVPTKEEQEANRKAAYTAEADPLFFMSQRGEATVEEWQAKVAEIKARYPYPEETQA
jgi:hypothetical protein